MIKGAYRVKMGTSLYRAILEKSFLIYLNHKLILVVMVFAVLAAAPVVTMMNFTTSQARTMSKYPKGFENVPCHKFWCSN
jgi:hypothetical protein